MERIVPKTEQTRYLIGDVASLMGLSRDTLRYYEKRGLLTSEKGENGYRYYTDQDIDRLMSILYQRKMNLSLEHMESLCAQEDSDTSLEDLQAILKQQIDQEEQAIRLHRQTIARLSMTLNDCRSIREKTGQVRLEELPPACVIVPKTTREEGIRLWFEYARQYSGLDMMYTVDEYNWQQNSGQIFTEYRNTQLILPEKQKEYVDYDFENHAPVQTTAPVLCVSAFQFSEDSLPHTEQLRPMLEWARRQEMIVSHQLYAATLLHGLNGESTMHYMQLYIPVF